MLQIRKGKILETFQFEILNALIATGKPIYQTTCLFVILKPYTEVMETDQVRNLCSMSVKAVTITLTNCLPCPKLGAL